MAIYNIEGIGTANVEKKTFRCSFNVSSDEFFERFSPLIEELPQSLINDLQKAIDTGKDVKFDKKHKDDLEDFFRKAEILASQQAQSEAQQTKMGFDESEKEEEEEAKLLESEDHDSESIEYEEREGDSNTIDTYDEDTGKKEGEITLSDKGAEGLLVPLTVIEKLKAYYDFNSEAPKEEGKSLTGEFKISNPSEKDKLWDIDITFIKEKEVSLEDQISIKNLAPKEEKVYEYEIQEFENPVVIVKEFVSTLNDPETESYALSINTTNTVYFRLNVKNIAGYPLKDVVIKKEIPEGFSNFSIGNSQEGSADIEEGNVVWKIESLEGGQEAELTFTMEISVNKAEDRVRTGKVLVDYTSEQTLSGLKIDRFNAYTNNFVGIEEIQKDDEPDLYICSVIFKNKSDFQVKLVNLDIVNAETGEKVIDIDPNDIPPIASQATWRSVEWETRTSEEGEEPLFYKTVEFFVLSNREHQTLGSIEIEDVELAVALMIGRVSYSITSIPSFRKVPFRVVHQVKNTGGAELNEVIFEEVIRKGFVPPKPEDVELYIYRPELEGDTGDDEFGELDWEDLGEQLEINPEAIEIIPNDQNPEEKHTVRIKLVNLRDDAIGMFLPGMIFRVSYPIEAYKVPKGEQFISQVKYIGNTYPAGTPIEVIPEEVIIPIIHERKRIAKGKTVRALPEPGEYEIILTVQNVGSTPLQNVKVRDIVPHNFEYTDLTRETTEMDSLEGKDMLIWNIEEIAPEEEVEIRYKLKGIGEDYKASESQLSA